MISEKMMQLGKKSSIIREIFEYGKKRKAEIGAENVFDFSLGNPSIKTPDCIDATIKELASGDTVSIHGYTSAAGDMTLREAISKNINERFL